MIEPPDKALNPTRRKFLDLILGVGVFTWIGSVFYPIARYLVPPRIAEIDLSSLEVGTLEDFHPNSSKILRFGRIPVIIIRQNNGEFHALGATCTHLDCTVQYKQDTEQIWCACHNGLFDIQGRNISGPPPKPLTRFAIVVRNKKVILTKEELA